MSCSYFNIVKVVNGKEYFVFVGDFNECEIYLEELGVDIDAVAMDKHPIYKIIEEEKGEYNEI